MPVYLIPFLHSFYRSDFFHIFWSWKLKKHIFKFYCHPSILFSFRFFFRLQNFDDRFLFTQAIFRIES